MSSNRPPERPESPEVPSGSVRPPWLEYPQVGDIVIYNDYPAIVVKVHEDAVDLVPVGSSEEVAEVSVGFEPEQWQPRARDMRDPSVMRNLPDEVMLTIRRGGPRAVE